MEETPGKYNPSMQVSARNSEEVESVNDGLVAVVDAVEAKVVDSAFIGGVAASGIGRPRATDDMDSFVRPEDAESALSVFAIAEFKPDGTAPDYLFKGCK